MKSLFLKKKNLIDNGSYIGYRLVRGLPVRNQRTHTNAKTNRKYL
jgi:ribosomal protein S13